MRPQALPHDGYVWAVAFSPDGALIASGSSKGTIRVWDAATGKTVASLAPDAGGVEAIAFSPDGARLAFVTERSEVQLVERGWLGSWRWGTRGAATATATAGLRFGSQAVAFSPDGRRLAVGGVGGATLGPVGEEGAVVSLCGPRELVSQTVGRMDDPDEEEVERPRRADAVAFSPDGRLLAVGFSCAVRSVRSIPEGAGLWIFDLATGEPAARLAERSAVRSLAYAPDGRSIAAATRDGVRLFAAPGSLGANLGDTAGVALGGAARAASVAFSPDGRVVAACTRPGGVSLLDADGRELRVLETGDPEPVIHKLAFSPDGSRLAAAGEEAGAALVWPL